MKKHIIATAVILSATLVSGGAFAVPGGAAKTLETPAANTTKVSCKQCRPHRNCCRNQCNGYYSLYTYVVPCNGAYGCGHGGYTCICGGFFGGIFGW
jgi:hypothetical protein